VSLNHNETEREAMKDRARKGEITRGRRRERETRSWCAKKERERERGWE